MCLYYEAFIAFARTSVSSRFSSQDTQQCASTSAYSPATTTTTATTATPVTPATADSPYPDTKVLKRAPSEEHAPWRAAHIRHSNIPLALTALIGRKSEVEAACRLLAQPKVRLLTLTGPPGIGKTRLGLEVAADPDVAEHFEDGVFLVE